MRRFHSYGPINNNVHYCAPRKELIEKAYTQLIGENPSEGGHYITVWAPRQCGKTWIMQQILFRLKKEAQFDVLKINLEILKEVEDAAMVMGSIARAIGEGLGKKLAPRKVYFSFKIPGLGNDLSINFFKLRRYYEIFSDYYSHSSVIAHPSRLR
jgi:hypothetical protein